MNIITLSRPLLARKFYRVLRFPYLNCSNLPKEAELKKTEHPTYPEIGRIIDRATIQHLERLSLVDFANIQGIARLEEAIRFADQIRSVDTTGVEPLISVLEDYDLALREDSVTEGGVAELVLSNASITEDDYFVAPPGNVPLEPKANYEH